MKADIEKDLKEYIARHPGRTVIVKRDIIDIGECPVNHTVVVGNTRYEVQMEDGTAVVVYPGEMFPE